MARALAKEINAVHVQGWTHASDVGGSKKGTLFFDDFGDLYKVNAGNLSLTAAIAARGGEFAIAASTEEVSFELDSDGLPDPTKLKTGNQELGKMLYSVYDKGNITLNLTGFPEDEISVGSLHGYISSIVIDIAVVLNHAKNMTATQTTVLLATENQRISVSGVSLDEEMTHLIRYQHAYQGASRVVTAMDEALDTIINRMGLVGRS